MPEEKKLVLKYILGNETILSFHSKGTHILPKYISNTKDEDRIVSVAYLHIIEMPANSVLLNGLYGEVLSVYTESDYRGKGICTKLMKNLVEYGKNVGLGRIDLSATDEGYSIYAKVGFKDKEHRYRDMRYKF